MADSKQKKETEKMTAEEWEKKLKEEEDPALKKLTREQYEKLLANQSLAKKLLAKGSEVLDNVATRAGEGTLQFLTKLANRLEENYDTAVGKPEFGTSIREAIYGPQQQSSYNQYTPEQLYRQEQALLAAGYTPEQIAAYRQEQALLRAGYTPEQVAAYQREQALAAAINAATTGAAANAAVTGTQTTLGPYGLGNQIGQVTPDAEKQVVFLLDNKNDVITLLSEWDNVDEAKAEAKKLTDQGLPAYYASKSSYLERAKLKS